MSIQSWHHSIKNNQCVDYQFGVFGSAESLTPTLSNLTGGEKAELFPKPSLSPHFSLSLSRNPPFLKDKTIILYAGAGHTVRQSQTGVRRG